jgi:hypothetical protein
MLAVSTRTNRSSTQRRHRSSSSAAAAPPLPNLGVDRGVGREQGTTLMRQPQPPLLQPLATLLHRPIAHQPPRLGSPGAFPAASSSADSWLMIALLSCTIASPSSLTIGTLRYLLHLSSALVSGLTSTVLYGSCACIGGEA